MNKHVILFCFGTRPEWLKIKPLVNKMKVDEYKLLFTGQHPDLLKDITVDYTIKLEDRTNRLDSVVSECLVQFPKDEFSSILVQGDTASAFACALAAYHRRLKIYYLEAGLRSYDLENPYPEEGYRQMISRIADVNLCPTSLSAENLKTEKVKGDVFIVGNTVLDNLTGHDQIEYGNTVLVTMHRRENHKLMDEWFTEINNIAEAHPHLKFILPIHPSPYVQKHKHILKFVDVIPPLDHHELINVVKNCRLIITDSGGLQEEGTFFNKKVIVCRKTTERPEGIETGHLHLCASPKELSSLFDKLNDNVYICNPCPYGDGHSAEKVYNILKNKS